tara:strand:- start:221 stop:1216 length:996 start_codon:yes stop_codon:yes gene_type:complete
MQKTYRYLAKNKVVVVANMSGFITEYRPVYQKNLNVYRGIDNLLYFEIKNHDQKNISLDGLSPILMAWNDENTLVIEKTGTSLDDIVTKETSEAQSAAGKTLKFGLTTGIAVGQTVTGTNIIRGSVVTAVTSDTVTLSKSTSASVPISTNITFQTSSKKGVFTVNVTENDLLEINQQYLKYVVYLEDSSKARTITYSNTHFDFSGVMFIDSKSMPGPKESVSVTDFVAEGDFWYAGSSSSNQITAEPALNGNNALHTVAVYTDGYIGGLEVQATLDNQITGANNWTTVSTFSFTGTETQPQPANFNGIYNYLRFKASADPANKITKVLVRN